MVAKQTKGRRASSRQAKADPVKRARAEAALMTPATVTPDPVLAGLLAQYAQNIAAHNPPDRDLTDEELNRLGDRYRELHQAIAAFPCSSLADLCAKVAIFREDLANMSPKDEPKTDLHELSLRFLISDLERLGGSAPAFATTAQDAASVEFGPIVGIKPPSAPEWDGLCDAHFDRIALAFDLLGKTKPELTRMWAAEEAAAGTAAAIERTRDWLIDTAAAVDEALARFLVAGAAAALLADDIPNEGAAA